MLEGVAVKIGRREFVVPPLTLWNEERLGKDEAYANSRAMGDLIRDLLSENYPDLTTDEVMKIVPRGQRRLEVVLKSVVLASMTDAEPGTGEAPRP